jgi:hypothetical protein
MNDRPKYPTTVEEWVEKNKSIIPKGATMQQIVEQIENDFDIPQPFRQVILDEWNARPEQVEAKRIQERKEMKSLLITSGLVLILLVYWLLSGMPIHW